MTIAKWSPLEPEVEAWRTGIESPYLYHVTAYQIITMMELKNNIIITVFITHMPLQSIEYNNV